MNESLLGLESIVVPPTPTPGPSSDATPPTLGANVERSEQSTPEPGQVCISVVPSDREDAPPETMTSPAPSKSTRDEETVMEQDQLLLLSPNSASAPNPVLIVTPGRGRAPSFIALPDPPIALDATAPSRRRVVMPVEEAASKEKHWRKKPKQGKVSQERPNPQALTHTAERPNWALAPDNFSSLKHHHGDSATRSSTQVIELRRTRSRTVSTTSKTGLSAARNAATRTRKHTSDAPDWALAPEGRKLYAKREIKPLIRVDMDGEPDSVQRPQANGKPVHTSETPNWALAPDNATVSSSIRQCRFGTREI